MVPARRVERAPGEVLEPRERRVRGQVQRAAPRLTSTSRRVRSPPRSSTPPRRARRRTRPRSRSVPNRRCARRPYLSAHCSRYAEDLGLRRVAARPAGSARTRTSRGATARRTRRPGRCWRARCRRRPSASRIANEMGRPRRSGTPGPVPRTRLRRSRPPPAPPWAGGYPRWEGSCSSRASTTSPRSPATRRATSTSTRACSACGWSPRPSTRTTRPSTTCSTPTSRAAPGSDLTFFEYPGAMPGRAGAGMVHRSSGASARRTALDFWAERLGRRGRRRSSATATACASPTPRASATSSSSTRRGDEPLAAEHPEIPAEHALQGFDGVRAYSDRPGAQRARCSSSVLGATRAGDDAWELRGERRGGDDRLRPAAGRARPPERRHRAPRRLGHDRRRAPALARAPRRRPACRTSGDHRPPLLPLDLLPRAERRAVRDRRRRPRLHRRRARSRSWARRIILPPRLEPHRERDRGAADPAARPARGPRTEAG